MKNNDQVSIQARFKQLNIFTRILHNSHLFSLKKNWSGIFAHQEKIIFYYKNKQKNHEKYFLKSSMTPSVGLKSI